MLFHLYERRSAVFICTFSVSLVDPLPDSSGGNNLFSVSADCLECNTVCEMKKTWDLLLCYTLGSESLLVFLPLSNWLQVGEGRNISSGLLGTWKEGKICLFSFYVHPFFLVWCWRSYPRASHMLMCALQLSHSPSLTLLF